MCSSPELALHTVRRTGREETPSTARSAPAGRVARTRSATSLRRGPAPQAPSVVRRSAQASHRTQARVVALFARREFERDNRRASPFMRALAIFFVSDKELQGCQQKRPEPALFR